MIAELFHADGQTDMTKLIAVFRNVANAPKDKDVVSKRLKPYSIRELLGSNTCCDTQYSD